MSYLPQAPQMLAVPPPPSSFLYGSHQVVGMSPSFQMIPFWRMEPPEGDQMVKFVSAQPPTIPASRLAMIFDTVRWKIANDPYCMAAFYKIAERSRNPQQTWQRMQRRIIQTPPYLIAFMPMTQSNSIVAVMYRAQFPNNIFVNKRYIEAFENASKSSRLQFIAYH